MKYTQSTLDKLEDILGESEYVVRYERYIPKWMVLTRSQKGSGIE